MLKPAVVVAALLTAGVFLSAEESTWYIGHSPKFVNITFESHTDVETILGSTNQAKGTVVCDLDAQKADVNITVPVSSMKTGIDMRDEHLRSEKWLDAAKFPEITFKSKEVKFSKDGSKVEVTGDFTMHGVTKEVKALVELKALSPEVVAKAKLGEGKWMKMTTEFDVKLTDFGVSLPDGGKVAEVWKIKMVLFGSTARPQEKK